MKKDYNPDLISRDFIPSTRKELKNKNWGKLDIIIISGDAHIDSPFSGASVIARVLTDAGFKTGIISQPDISSDIDIKRLGEPALFWGITAGSIDSMVSNYTASGKKRKKDDLTPGGINNKRPDLATIKYTNLVKRYFKNTAPIVLGGIEASLRRIPHYDYISKKIRRSILFDSKADYILFGMADKSVVELARCCLKGKSPLETRGLCYISSTPPDGFIELPSFEKVFADKKQFKKMFIHFYKNTDPVFSKGMFQKHGSRYLIINPSPEYLTKAELDHIYELPFTRKVHPYDAKKGKVKAMETIKTSITTHRGCYGECNFCAIAVHQGRRVVSRSQNSILREASSIASQSDFKGYISDLGGPTANMYGFECKKKEEKGACTDKRCLFPNTCKALKPDHKLQIELIQKIEKIKNVKKVFIASGIRYDLILQDKKNGQKYLKKILDNNISGQLKIAPEHSDPKILALMGKPDISKLLDFKKLFDMLNKKKKKNFLTYYFIAAYPGCGEKEMKSLKIFCNEKLRFRPEQIQIFTPTPSTIATMMYYCGETPENTKIFIPSDIKEKNRQKKIIVK